MLIISSKTICRNISDSHKSLPHIHRFTFFLILPAIEAINLVGSRIVVTSGVNDLQVSKPSDEAVQGHDLIGGKLDEQ